MKFYRSHFVSYDTDLVANQIFDSTVTLYRHPGENLQETWEPTVIISGLTSPSDIWLTDTLGYIKFHLEKARARPDLFTESACRQIFQFEAHRKSWFWVWKTSPAP